MKQIDAKPTDYRREDPETGEMKYPVNKRLARGLAIAGTAFAIFLIWKFSSEGGNPIVATFLIGFGATIGACAILSLRRPDW